MHQNLPEGGTTMQFASRLPRGARSQRYSVIAPEGGLNDTIDEFLRGNTPFLDLTVIRDFTGLLVRVAPLPDELIQDSDTVFRIEGATGILLDEDGQTTGDIVTVTGFLNKEATSKGMPAGMLTIWKRSLTTGKGVA